MTFIGIPFWIGYAMKDNLIARTYVVLFGSLATFLSGSNSADIITVVNPGFEDTSGQTVFNEFTFGTPNGWTLHDPNGIVAAGFYPGTLEPNGVEFFDELAPEGTRVAILFNNQGQGTGEWGFQQILSDTLQPYSHYELSIQVGNIGSGYATNGEYFDLSGFPGYRVELLAGDQVIAQDNNSLIIDDREWGTSIVEFTTGGTHDLLGQNLGIRIVNLNVIPAGYTAFNAPDSEVDFDQVSLNVTAVPEAGALFVISSWILVAWFWPRKKRRRRRPAYFHPAA